MLNERDIKKILKPLFIRARNGDFITPLIYNAYEQLKELIDEEKSSNSKK